MTKQLWAKGIFKRHSGFSKDYTVSKNLARMAESTNLRKPANVWVRVGRQAQSLANLTADKQTKLKAKQVANKAFLKLAKIHKMEK